MVDQFSSWMAFQSVLILPETKVEQFERGEQSEYGYMRAHKASFAAAFMIFIYSILYLLCENI